MPGRYDDILKDMWKEFASSSENEHNWQHRAKLIEQLDANLEKGRPGAGVPHDFIELFKHVNSSIVATANSERTQLSGKACHLIATLAKYLGTQIHPFLDVILPTIIQLCASTKKLNQTNGNRTMTAILQCASYSPRLLYHVCATFNEKRMEARMFATAWLMELLETYKHALDPSKDYPTIEKAINSALNDAQTKVREAARATYWEFAKLPNNTADKIMDSLNSHAAQALRADSHNPNKATQAQAGKVPRPESALSQIRAAKSKQAQQTAKRPTSPVSTQPAQVHDSLFDSLERADRPVEAAGPQPTSPKSRHPQSRQTEPDHASNMRHLMSAPVRRPRVVATPIQPQTAQVTSRPTSKGDSTKKPSESKDRSTQEKKSGRQTPVIAEDKESHQPLSHHVKKSSVHKHKPESSVSSVPRPTSSSSEQSSIRSPRRLTEPRRPVDPVPAKHQNSLSTSEARANTRPEPMRLKPTSPSYPTEDKENPEPVQLKTMSPPYTIEGKENTAMDAVKTPRATSPSIDKARRSIPSIVDSLKRGRLDALGYRKLQKLVENNPHELLASEEQFHELYASLIAALVDRDNVQSRDRVVTNINHPAYNRFSILHTILALFEQYPNYEEPMPGCTVSALLRARSEMSEQHTRVIEALEKAADAICLSPRIQNDPFPSIHELMKEITALEQSNGDKKADGSSRVELLSNIGHGIAFGLHMLTTILNSLAASAQTLEDGGLELELATLAKNTLSVFRTVSRRDTIHFCCALHKLIKPEDRFFDMFEAESDRNLIYYCVRNQTTTSIGS